MIKISVDGLGEVTRDILRLQKIKNRAVYQSLRKASKDTAKEGAKMIADVKYSDMTKNEMLDPNAKPKRIQIKQDHGPEVSWQLQEARVEFSDNGIPITFFKPRDRFHSMGPYGANYEVMVTMFGKEMGTDRFHLKRPKKSEKYRSHHKGATEPFTKASAIFRREGKDQYPLRIFHFTSLAGVLRMRGLEDRLEDYGYIRLERHLDRELRRYTRDSQGGYSGKSY